MRYEILLTPSKLTNVEEPVVSIAGDVLLELLSRSEHALVISGHGLPPAVQHSTVQYSTVQYSTQSAT